MKENAYETFAVYVQIKFQIFKQMLAASDCLGWRKISKMWYNSYGNKKKIVWNIVCYFSIKLIF